MSRKYFKRFSPEQTITSEGVLGTTVAFNVFTGKNDVARMNKGQAFFVIRSSLASSAAYNAVSTTLRRTYNYQSAIFSTAREKINNGGFTVINNFAHTDTTLKRQRYSKDYLDTVGHLMALNSDAAREAEAAAFVDTDHVWIPSCLSSFQIDELLPSTNLRLEFDVNSSAYKTSCCENIDPTDAAVVDADVHFKITQIELYILIEENAMDTPVNKTHTYNLAEYKTILKNVSGPDVREVIKVDPSVVSITYALQHKDAMSNTHYSPTKFEPIYLHTPAVAGGAAAVYHNAYDDLRNQYLTYNNVNYPENMNNCVLSTTQDIGRKLSVYMNLAYNGLLWNGSGYEGYDNFNTQYGRYFTYDLEKDASVQVTDATIQMNFNGSIDCKLVCVTSNTFKLTVAYDAYGNMTSAPLKEIASVIPGTVN